MKRPDNQIYLEPTESDILTEIKIRNRWLVELRLQTPGGSSHLAAMSKGILFAPIKSGH
jgi:hypothetical protein